MIRAFRCRDTEALFNRLRLPRFQSIERVARRKLTMLNNAQSLQDLRVPPGNRLEQLAGDRQANTASASMTSGESALSGAIAMLTMSRLWTITRS